jgi:predicted TIM-barrel fold metal-dependent hydrolase
MSIIDAHVHLYPEELNRDPAAWGASKGETHWALLSTRRRKSGHGVQAFPSVDQLLQTMDQAGVERSILQGWYWQWPETCVVQNQFYSECVKAHPDRLSAFATIHPAAGREATLQQVREARELGFCGLGELSPHSQGFDVSDPVFQEAMELAGQMRLPVNFHVTDRDTAAYPGRIETPGRDFIWLARSFAHTNFILSHWGGRLPLRDEEAEELYNIFYDTAASPLMYPETIWGSFMEVVPSERILFGSDYPLNLYPKLDAEPDMRRFIGEARRNGVDLNTLSVTTRRLLHL